MVLNFHQYTYEQLFINCSKKLPYPALHHHAPTLLIGPFQSLPHQTTPNPMEKITILFQIEQF